MANGVVATSKALKEKKVVCVSKQAGKHVRQRDQTQTASTYHFIHAKAGFWSSINIKINTNFK